MADCIILAQNFEPATAGNVKITGIAQESSASYWIGWDTTVAYASNASQINAAIIAAVIAEFAKANITIGGSDKKILLGGAV